MLDNPFGASITLYTIFANATHRGIPLGIIDVSAGNSPIHAPGHSNTTSPLLPLKFNTNPLYIIGLLKLTAAERNVDLGPLAALFQLVLDNPDYHPPITYAPVTNGTAVCNRQAVRTVFLISC